MVAPNNPKFNPERSGGQSGGSFPGIKSANFPLDTREGDFQNATQQQKAYVVKSQKMPSIEFIQNEEPGDKVRPFPADRVAYSKKHFREESFDQINDPNVNLREKFITNDYESSSFGKTGGA